MSEHQCEHRPDSIPAVSVLRHLTRSSYCATNDNGLTAVISLHQTTIIFSAVQGSHREKLQHCTQNQWSLQLFVTGLWNAECKYMYPSNSTCTIHNQGFSRRHGNPVFNMNCTMYEPRRPLNITVPQCNFLKPRYPKVSITNPYAMFTIPSHPNNWFTGCN